MKWLTIDPGETVGFAGWEGDKLLYGEQRPMWEFIDNLAGFQTTFSDETGAREPTFGLIVVEDWILTHNRQRRDALAGDKCRTARAIGAIELIGRLSDTRVHLQPNKIKSRAEAAGAENLFLTPLHENRHANDAIRHGVYYLARHGPPGEGSGG